MQLEDELSPSAGTGLAFSEHRVSNRHDGQHSHYDEGHGGVQHGEGAEGEEGEGPWLLSYADMVTLLMCFFILFFQANKKNGKYDEQQKVLARLKKLVTEVKQDENAEDESPSSSSDSPSSVSLDTVFALGHTSPNTVEIVLLTSNMFVAGLAEVTPDGRASIEAVADNLQTLPSDSLIEIEGHTDSVPIHKGRFIDNWELSAARAISVLRILEKEGIAVNRMRAIGLAHYRPLVPERDSRGFSILSNQALNRRVVIRLKMNPDRNKKGILDTKIRPSLDRGSTKSNP